MGLQRKAFLCLVLATGIFFSSNAYSADSGEEDERALFTSIAADALIVLDLSRSMNWIPTGGIMYTHNDNLCDADHAAFYTEYASGHTKDCTFGSGDVIPKYSESTCSGGTNPFYKAAENDGYKTDCSRLAIAKRALFDILDDNDDNLINESDEKTLNIRFGYMRFYNCSTGGDGTNYTSGCNTLIRPLETKYSQIYCNASSKTSPADECSILSSFGTSAKIVSESAYGGTPLAAALNEAKLYLDVHKAGDASKACRQKFVILITDGADTFSCDGNGSELQTDQYKRRRETVAKAKLLADAGYKVFVVGFGAAMPHWLRNTLNWSAYYGGTDNPLDGNLGITTAYDPASVTSCQTSDTASHDIEGDGTHYYAVENDPGEKSLSGYAFLATTAPELTTALKKTIEMIREVTYSFSTPSVSSQRSLDENYLYEASFQYVGTDSFWKGHLKKYQIDSDGNVGAEIWDAGDVLAAANPGSRYVYTHTSNSVSPSYQTPFNTSITNIKTLLGVTSLPPKDDTDISAIIGFFRGEATYNKENWKLGDIFHSNPINIGTPNPYFWDMRDTGTPTGFETYRNNHIRTSALNNRLILVGANDGQFHAFRTSNASEVWSFIPPNFLPKLKNISHDAHPTGLTHQYFVDGPITAADIWIRATSTPDDGTVKSSSEWHTLAIFGEGRGGGTTLWSSQPSCAGSTSDFKPIYIYSVTATDRYDQYCGYYAFDFSGVVDESNPPVYRWHIKDVSAARGPYFGEPWSKVMMGRVLVSGKEKWVGFMGGGFNASDCSGGGSCDTRGKGFFVVDLADGTIYWSFTKADNTNMKYSLASSPAIADTDGDGFVDTVYVGDLGGNVWRIKLCTKNDGSSCDTSNWSGGLFFDSSTGTIRPIYMTPTIAKDAAGNVWVYWGTGDKTDPTTANAQEKFHALKDTSRTGTYQINDLQNITTGTYSDTSKYGWYINLSGGGEKILGEPTIFNGVAYFSTYTPPSGNNPCEQAGTAKLYGVNYVSGAAALQAVDGDGAPTGSLTRSMDVGSGIPSSPVLSIKPPGDTGDRKPDIYMTVSGGGASGASTEKVPNSPPTLPRNTNLLFWKDRRLQ